MYPVSWYAFKLCALNDEGGREGGCTATTPSPGFALNLAIFGTAFPLPTACSARRISCLSKSPIVRLPSYIIRNKEEECKVRKATVSFPRRPWWLDGCCRLYATWPKLISKGRFSIVIVVLPKCSWCIPITEMLIKPQFTIQSISDGFVLHLIWSH